MISVYSRKTEIEVTQRKLEQMEKYNKLISRGRKFPAAFVEEVMKIPLLDYQSYVIMNSWTAEKSVWLFSRNAGKSFCGAIFMMLKALLFANSQIWIMSYTAKQSMDTFLKMENIAKQQISSIVGGSAFFNNEIMRSIQSAGDGWVHDSQEYSCRLYNGSKITSLVGAEKNIVGKRSVLNCYDEAGKLSENFFALTEPFTTQNTDFKTGAGIDTSLIPKSVPTQCLYMSSAEDVDSHLYMMYKTCALAMMSGRRDMFCADINCDIPLNPTLHGKKYTPLFKKSEVETAMATNEYRALREYYNLFDTTGGTDSAITRDVFTRNEYIYLPIMGGDKDPEKLYGLFYDPALQQDNSFILIAEYFRDEKKGWMARVVNGINLIHKMSNGDKKILRSTEQLDWVRKLMLAYNGPFEDYRRLKLMIDPGSGGGGRIYADQLMPDWVDEHGNVHPGIVDMEDETSKGEAYKFPHAKTDVLRLLNAQKWKTVMFDAAVEMMRQDLIMWPVPMPNSGKIEINGREHPLTKDEIRAWAEIDLVKEEFLNIKKLKTDAGNVVYRLPPDKIRRLHDDRAYAASMMGFMLSELRRKDKFNIEVPKQDFSVMFSSSAENKKQQANPFAGRKNPFLGRNPFRR